MNETELSLSNVSVICDCTLMLFGVLCASMTRRAMEEDFPRLQTQSCLSGERMEVRRNPVSRNPFFEEQRAFQHHLLISWSSKFSEQRRRIYLSNKIPLYGRADRVLEISWEKSSHIFEMLRLPGLESAKDALPSRSVCSIRYIEQII